MGYTMIYPYTAAMFNIMSSFSKVWPGILQSCNDDIYLPQNFGSLKSMEGLPLTTLWVQVSDPIGINDGTLCSLSITTI